MTPSVHLEGPLLCPKGAEEDAASPRAQNALPETRQERLQAEPGKALFFLSLSHRIRYKMCFSNKKAADFTWLHFRLSHWAVISLP